MSAIYISILIHTTFLVVSSDVVRGVMTKTNGKNSADLLQKMCSVLSPFTYTALKFRLLFFFIQFNYGLEIKALSKTFGQRYFNIITCFIRWFLRLKKSLVN